jgi:hypothetical protein
MFSYFVIYLTPASLENTEDPEKSNLFLQSGDTDWRKNSQRHRRKKISNPRGLPKAWVFLSNRHLSDWREISLSVASANSA